MDYIIDARKYLPNFLHDSSIMLNIMDCINALISNEQPIFGEIKGAYDDMLYRCSDYSKLTYQAKINIIKELGFEYIIDILDFTDDKLTSLLTFFELIYSLKGKEEGLKLCLDHILNTNKEVDPVLVKTTKQQIILKNDYLSDITGEFISDDFKIDLQFYKDNDPENNGYGYGELIVNNKRIYFDQDINNNFGDDNTEIIYNFCIDSSEDNTYRFYLTDSNEGNLKSLFSLTLNQYSNSYNELENKYAINNINVLSPANWRSDRETFSLYTYTPWDKMNPIGQQFTATLDIVGNEFSNAETLEKLTTFVRSYILPWVEITPIFTIDAGGIYIIPILGLLAFESSKIINGVGKATLRDLAYYDQDSKGNKSYYDSSPEGKQFYYATEVATGPNQVEREKFNNVLVEVKIMKYDPERRIYTEVTEDAEVYIGVYQKPEYSEETQTLLEPKVEYEKTNKKEVEQFIPIKLKAIYNEQVKEYEYVANGERTGDLAQIIYF